MAPSGLSKLNTALQFLVVGCGLTSAAFAVPPPPREEDAALLRWEWRGGEHGGERGGERGKTTRLDSGANAGAIETAGATDTASTPSPEAGGGAFPWSVLPPAEPARLALPLLVVAVATTTLASGADYFIKAARVLSRFR